jgi:hypothetical protein
VIIIYDDDFTIETLKELIEENNSKKHCTTKMNYEVIDGKYIFEFQLGYYKYKIIEDSEKEIVDSVQVLFYDISDVKDVIRDYGF